MRIGATVASLAVVAGLSLPLPALADTADDAAAVQAAAQAVTGEVDAPETQAADTAAGEDAQVAEDESAAQAPDQAEDAATEGTEGAVQLTDFATMGSTASVTCEDGVITIEGTGGDHFARPAEPLFAKSFVFEADAKADVSAALAIVSMENGAGSPWYAFNFNNDESNALRSRFFGGDNNERVTFSLEELDGAGIDTHAEVHLKIDMKSNGDYTLTIADAADQGRALSKSAHLDGWNGGYLALLAFNSGATFRNVSYVDNTQADTPADATVDWGDGKVASNFITDPAGQFAVNGGGSISVEDGSVVMGSTGLGDLYAVVADDERSYGDMVYSVKVTFAEPTGCASLVFHANGDFSDNKSYVANIDAATGACRIFKNGDSKITTSDLVQSKTVALSADNTYELAVTQIGKHVVFTVNGEVVGNTGDYTANSSVTEEVNAHHGQGDALLSGYCGLLTYNAKASYTDINVTPITDENSTQLSSLKLRDDGTDMNFAFAENQYLYVGYVFNETASTGIEFTAVDPDATVTVADANGSVCDPSNLALRYDGEPSVYDMNSGLTPYTVTVENPGAPGAKTLYQLRLFRENPSDTYYNETWRDQYHFSVKNGWGNDPCGMVKIGDTWHFFYQAYTDADWGPMHWGHATSTDLVHWTEQPLALYPDEYGAMFSGCGVAADHETARTIFDEGESGMVFMVTANGRNGVDDQRLCLAYSKDGGQTFQKQEMYVDADGNNVGGVILDYQEGDEDPLHNAAFRDPKIFRYDGHWFMIVAGGPVRIYKSDDLISWTCEQTRDDINTECPDLYPVKAEDGTVKWVLSRGGITYRIGTFGLMDNGHYGFVEDSATDYPMNFGLDHYAAMTFFLQGEDFGTEDAVNAPDDLISANWMNNWAYNRIVQTQTGNYTFNGTYTLMTRLSLVKTGEGDDSYRLAQTPLTEYESLRDEDNATKVTDALLGDGSENPFAGFAGTSYEMVVNAKPQEGTPVVNLDLRVGGNQYTRLSYDFSTQKLSLDRSHSGVNLNDQFAAVQSSDAVPNEDGSVDLHIYVDRMSVEVYAQDDTVNGTAQIFPVLSSDGLSATAENGTAVLNATVYPLESIWNTAAEEPGDDVEQPSKDALQAAVDEAAGLAEDGYAADSWQALQDALAASQAVLDDPDATAEDIAAAEQALAEAVAGLQKADQGDQGQGGDQGDDQQGGNQGQGGNDGQTGDDGQAGTGSDQGASGSDNGSDNGSDASGSNGSEGSPGGSTSQGDLPTTGDAAAIAAGVSAFAGAGALTGAAVLRRRKRR